MAAGFRASRTNTLVAQWIEQVPTKFRVVGSNPIERSIQIATAVIV